MKTRKANDAVDYLDRHGIIINDVDDYFGVEFALADSREPLTHCMEINLPKCFRRAIAAVRRGHEAYMEMEGE